MEDFLYSYNQPKKFGKYDLFLDGKVTVNELVYKILTEEGEYQNIDIAEKVKEIESRLQTHFTFEHVDELPTEGKATVIYLVPNDETSGDKDSYNEYMWDKKHEKFELIGSGTYAQQKAELDAESDRAKKAEETLTTNLAKEVTDRTKAVSDEEKRAKDAEKVLTDDLAQEIEDREADVDAEEQRATKAEGELSARIKTIEDYKINTRVNKIETDLPAEVSRAKKAEEALQAQITALVSKVETLQKDVVVLELPNCEIHNETVSQEYIVGSESKIVTVTVNVAKGTMAEENTVANVTVGEIQDTMGVTISQLGALSGTKEIVYILGETKTIETSSVTNQDGSITETTTTTPYTHKLPITVVVSGGHKEPSVSVTFGDKTEEAGTPTENTVIIPAPQPEEPETPTEPTE